MSIISLLVPLIILASLGFYTTKAGFLHATTLQQLSKLTFNGAIPALLFVKMATAQLSSTLSFSYFIAFYFPVACCYLFAVLVSKYFFQLNLVQGASISLAASYSNTVIIGLPILLNLFGTQAVVYVFAIVTFHSALLFISTNLLAGLSKQTRLNTSWQKNLTNSLINPLVLSISLGALTNLLAIKLPDVVVASLQLIAQPALPLALFILGTSLVGLTIKGNRRIIIFASCIKMLLLPIFIFTVSHYWLQLPKLQQQVLILLSACPTGINAYLVAKHLTSKQQKESQSRVKADEVVASTVVTTTLFATCSLPCWLWLIQHL